MKKAICFMAICAFAATASASVDFFFTKSTDMYGLAGADPFKATAGNQTDFLDGYALNANGAPNVNGLTDIMINLDDPDPGFAYVWGRFTTDEPNGAKINGIAIEVTNALAGEGNIAWYKGDNLMDFNLPAQFKRWDGDNNVFYFNPAGLVAVTALGVQKIPGNNATTQANMYQYDVAKGGGIFLLGAVKAQKVGDMMLEFGSIPVNYAVPPNPSVSALNKVIVVPEPASMLLLGLAGLMIRRR